MHLNDRFPLPVDWVSEETELLATQVARWAEREVISKRTTHREAYETLHAPALRSLMREVGLQDLLWPEEGPDGLQSATTIAAVIEQVGRADMGLGVLLANTCALQRVVPDSLKARLSEKGALAGLVLPDYARQEGAPSPGLHGLGAQASARREGDTWRVWGDGVRPQCHGAKAAFFGVVCEVDGGPALFAVPGEAQGVTRGAPLQLTGLWASHNADLRLKDVTVPDDQLLLQGDAAYHALLAWYYLGCASAAGGGMLALWKILDDWCESRVIKGKGQPFKSNPLVASMLGEIAGWIGPNRLLLYSLARLLEHPPTDHGLLLATATGITRTVLRGAMDALDKTMELMGSAGYSTEWNLERYWRDTKTLQAQLLLETAGQMDLARHCFGCESL